MTYDTYPEYREHKRVTLCNLSGCENLARGDARWALMGMGVFEWEDYMDNLLMKAVTKARENGDDTADITDMFSCDMVGIDDEGKYTKSQKNVIAHLMEKLFNKVSETEEELTVSIKENVPGMEQKSLERFMKP